MKVSKMDRMLSYSTVKVVKVQDWILGLIHYIFLLGILGYIVYNTIVSQLYLKKSSPVASSVRLTAELDLQKMATQPPPSYCLNPTPGVSGCLYWTADEIVFPYPGEINTLFITTRVTISTSQALPAACVTPPQSAFLSALTPQNYNCTPQSISATANKKKYYIANVEDVTILLDHSVRTQFSSGGDAGKFDYASYNEIDMDGKLISGCKNAVGSVAINFNATTRKNSTYNTKLDVISVRDLLRASACSSDGNATGLKLDSASNSPGSAADETWRSTGTVISVPIYYENEVGNPQILHYTYLPAQLNGTEYKIVQHITNPDGTVTYLNRHGIRIILTQFGAIGVFDFQSLLINLVAALALTKFATTLVDLLMLYVMPRRHSYKEAKYDEEVIDKTKKPENNDDFSFGQSKLTVNSTTYTLRP
ncbi:cytochrome c oxidase subunit 1 [Nowakowskiella sp. JEL0407]|nr:cytochrome c oxidase subunit 1 [Nowakowskiella sp. JEL0407]